MIEVQGELELSAYERVAAAALEHADPRSIVLLDLTRVTRVEPGLAPLLGDLVDELALDAVQLAVVIGPAETLLERVVDELRRARSGSPTTSTQRSSCCEDALLAEEGHPSALGRSDIADHPVMRVCVPALRAHSSSTRSERACSPPASRSSRRAIPPTRSTSSPRGV